MEKFLKIEKNNKVKGKHLFSFCSFRFLYPNSKSLSQSPLSFFFIISAFLLFFFERERKRERKKRENEEIEKKDRREIANEEKKERRKEDEGRKYAQKGLNSRKIIEKCIRSIILPLLFPNSALSVHGL